MSWRLSRKVNTQTTTDEDAKAPTAQPTWSSAKATRWQPVSLSAWPLGLCSIALTAFRVANSAWFHVPCCPLAHFHEQQGLCALKHLQTLAPRIVSWLQSVRA